METTSPFKEIQALQEEQREATWERKSDADKDAAIVELIQRLNDQRESFQAQLIRIEDGWREKLRDVRQEAHNLIIADANLAQHMADRIKDVIQAAKQCVQFTIHPSMSEQNLISSLKRYESLTAKRQ
jgi:hypothetical protein